VIPVVLQHDVRDARIAQIEVCFSAELKDSRQLALVTSLVNSPLALAIFAAESALPSLFVKSATAIAHLLKAQAKDPSPRICRGAPSTP
jgi:hypothetical protein